MTGFESPVGEMQRFALQRAGLHFSCRFLNGDVSDILHQLHLLTLGFHRHTFPITVHILDFEVSLEIVL